MINHKLINRRTGLISFFAGEQEVQWPQSGVCWCRHWSCFWLWFGYGFFAKCLFSRKCVCINKPCVYWRARNHAYKDTPARADTRTHARARTHTHTCRWAYVRGIISGTSDFCSRELLSVRFVLTVFDVKYPLNCFDFTHSCASSTITGETDDTNMAHIIATIGVSNPRSKNELNPVTVRLTNCLWSKNCTTHTTEATKEAMLLNQSMRPCCVYTMLQKTNRTALNAVLTPTASKY